MIDIIKKLILMVDLEIDILVKNKCYKDEYIANIKSVGDDVLMDKQVLQQIAKAENSKLEVESNLVDLHDMMQSLREIQSHCNSINPKNNETFSGFIAQFGPQPEKYRVFNELLGKGWAVRMKNMPVNNVVWQQLDLILGGAANE